MGLWFQNADSYSAYVAVLWYDPNCAAQPWRKSGWYEIAPGSSAQIIGADLRTIADSNFAWFAQAEWADGPCWSGDPAHHWYSIPHNAAFSQCYDDNTGCNAAYPFNATALSRASADWTILLLQPGVAGRGFQGCSFGFAGKPTAHVLDFTVQPQLESNWCWAAVSTSIAHYYNNASTVTQCQVVNDQLGRSDCCQNPGSSHCNVDGYLDKALKYVGHLASTEGSAATYSAISDVIDDGTPPCIRIGWSGGGGHFIGVYGIEPSDMLWVTDPIFGQSLASYATLTGGTYQTNGKWTDTFFTH
jgi:Papain-like cysteine protease AvrRpt2